MFAHTIIMKKFISCYFTLLCFSLVFISCKEEVETQQETKTQNNTNSLYGDTSFKFPKISNLAREQMIEWAVFEDFEMQAKTINGSTIEGLKTKAEQLVLYSDSLTNKMPDTLKTQAIKSRVIVLQSRNQLLNQELKKGRIDSVKLQKSITEVNKSISNLVLQINEKFQKDNIDFTRKEDEKKELEKQKRFLDSVYQSELQDQKK